MGLGTKGLAGVTKGMTVDRPRMGAINRAGDGGGGLDVPSASWGRRVMIHEACGGVRAAAFVAGAGAGTLMHRQDSGV